MLSWVKSDCDAQIITERTHAVLAEVNQLVERKLIPIHDEYMYSSLHDSRAVSTFSESVPHVSLIGIPCEFTSSVISTLIGSNPGLSSEILVHVGSSFIPNSKSVSGVRLVPHAEFSCVLDTFSLACTPFELGKHVVVQSSLVVFLVFDLEQGVLELSGPVRDSIKSLRGICDRVRLVVNSQTNLLPLIWQLSKLLPLPELIKTYVVTSSSEEKNLLGCELSPVEIYRDILSCVDIWMVRRLDSLRREAKSVRAHAALLAFIKSQLPLIYGQESKLNKILERISAVFPSAAAKFGVPLDDFYRFSDDIFITRLRSFDFRQIKKVKETSFQKICEFIDQDLPRLSQGLPKEPTKVLLRLSRPPNLGEYLEDFQALGPEGGAVGGALVRDHLLGISRLGTRELHKIWKLADVTKDGKLTMFEYALCRELILLVQDGDTLPVSLPLSVFEH